MQALLVRRQEVAPPALLIGRTLLVERRHRQRGVEEVVGRAGMESRGPKQRPRLVGGRESFGVVARQEARLELEDPVPADHRGPPVPRQLCLECRLVELRVAEGGERHGPTLHGRDEALLAHDDVRVEPGSPGELQCHLRLAPHRVERIVAQEKIRDRLGYAVAGVSQIPRLGRGAKGRPREIDRGCDRLGPHSNYSHREVDPCPVSDKAVLLDQIACELGETITFAVSVKHRAEDAPEAGQPVRGSAARPVLHADVHHAAHEQVK